MLILHGENTVQSRNRLMQVLEVARAAGKHVTHVDAKNLTLGELERVLGTTSLFAEPQVIVLEELHSLPKSKRRDELIAFVGGAQQQLDPAITLLLWEKRPLTAPMVGKFPGAKAESFALTKSLFAWLDSLVGTPNERQRQQMLKLLLATIASDGEVMCLVMLARQVRLLLELSDGGGQAMPPFMAAKLRRQLQTFTEQQLLQLHRKLLELDLEQKTSRPPLPLAAQLELLLATM